MGTLFNTKIVKVGKSTYGSLNVYSAGRDADLVIGDYCSIAPNVSFVMNNEHRINTFSTYPFKVMALGSKTPEALSKGGIKVGDGVWIGFGATVLDGVSIGSGAIVGAGAVVAKDVPACSIVVGVPARVVRYRFEDELCEVMGSIDYSRINERFIRDNIDALYKPMDSDLLNSLIKQLEQM